MWPCDWPLEPTIATSAPYGERAMNATPIIRICLKLTTLYLKNSIPSTPKFSAAFLKKYYGHSLNMKKTTHENLTG